MSYDDIAIVVLAAGGSTRMGSPKALLPFGDTTLIQYIISESKATGVKEVVVVLGAYEEEIRKVIVKEGVSIETNEHWASGMSASIKKGIAKVDKSCQAVIICAVDQPSVTHLHFTSMIRLFESKSTDMVVSSYGGTRGIPALFSKKLFPQLQQLEGDKGAKKLFNNSHFKIAEINLSEGEVDLDTMEDFENWNKR